MYVRIAHRYIIVGCLLLVILYFTGCIPPAGGWFHKNTPRHHVTLNETFLQKNLITVEFLGRLGNQMFEYAALLGMAHANNKTAVVSAECSLLDFFELGSSVVGMPRLAQKVNATQPAALMRQLLALGPGSFVVNGHLQSWKYFDSVSTEVRRNFVLLPSLARRALTQRKQLLDEIMISRRKKVVVGVHVRRSDMRREFEKTGRMWATAHCGYFRKAAGYMIRLYGLHETIFLVCSDDYGWTRRCFKTIHIDHVLCPPDNAAIADFALLTTAAQHMIISVGTFSWWVAYLVNGTTVYYNRFPTVEAVDSELFGYVADDYFLPQWIPIQ